MVDYENTLSGPQFMHLLYKMKDIKASHRPMSVTMGSYFLWVWLTILSKPPRPAPEPPKGEWSLEWIVDKEYNEY